MLGWVIIPPYCKGFLDLNKPRSVRDLEKMTESEVEAFRSALSDEEMARFLSTITPEEIEAIPEETRENMRSARANTLERALSELEAEKLSDGRFMFAGEGEAFEITAGYCRKRLLDLAPRLEKETEESLYFYGYHNLRLWVEAYNFLLQEMGEVSV